MPSGPELVRPRLLEASRLGDVLSRAEGEPLLVPALAALEALEQRDAVALPARVRRLVLRQPLGVDDRVVGLARRVRLVTAARVPVELGVLAAGAVACLAGDAELGDVGVHLVAARHPRATVGRVALVADAVPAPRVRFLARGRRTDAAPVERHPARLVDEPVADRHDSELARLPRCGPEELEMVRARHLHDPPPDAIAVPRPRRVELDPELVTAAVEAVGLAAGDHLDVVEGREHGLGARDGRHRAVVGAVPRAVLLRMARLAGLRGHVPVAVDRDRPVRDRLGCAHRRGVARRRPGHGRRGQRPRRERDRAHAARSRLGGRQHERAGRPRPGGP